MKILILFLLIPMTAYSADMCTELGTYYAKFEKQLASKTIDNCAAFDLTDSDDDKFLKGLASDELSYKDDDEKNKAQNLFEQVRCKDISFLENRMRDVEAQLNSINGFSKLVDTITTSQKEIQVDKKADKAELDAFIADVGTAALLETYVTNPVLFKFLTEDDLKDAKTYKDGVAKHCVSAEVKKLRLKDVCDSLTSEEISDSSLTSLRELLKTYSDSKDDKKQTDLLTSWADELVIQKASADPDAEAEEYSFVDLNKDIQNKPTSTMAQMLKTIKETPKIIHTKGVDGQTIDKLFKRIVTYQAKREDNLEAKRLVTVHTDLFERQKAERESRLSLLWLEFKPIGSVETDFDKQVNILKTVQLDKAKTNPSEATHLAEALRALEATTRQMNKLENVTKCLDVDLINKDTVKKVCENTVKMDLADEDKQKLSSELKLLERIHGEIVNKPVNDKLVKMKRLAMDALNRNKCTSTNFESSMSDCKIDGVINPEMKNILITGLDVSLMYVEPTTEELDDAKEICEGTDKSEYNAFCALASKEESKNKRPDRSNEKYNGPMDPESRNNPFNQALYNGARNLASQIGQILQQNRTPYYMTNGVGAYGPASPTISQYLIGTSVASGQLRPYSSVTQNNFAYKPLR